MQAIWKSVGLRAAVSAAAARRPNLLSIAPENAAAPSRKTDRRSTAADENAFVRDMCDLL
jgi:hypothetical protein